MDETELSIDEIDPWDGPEKEDITESEKQRNIKLLEAYGFNFDGSLQDIENILSVEDIAQARLTARQNCLQKGDLSRFEFELASNIYKLYTLKQ